MPQCSTITTPWWECRVYSSGPPPSVTSVDLLSANWTWIVAYAVAQWGSNHINKQVHNDFGILYSCASLASLPLYLWWIALVHAGESLHYRMHLPIILTFVPDQKKRLSNALDSVKVNWVPRKWRHVDGVLWPPTRKCSRVGRVNSLAKHDTGWWINSITRWGMAYLN